MFLSDLVHIINTKLLKRFICHYENKHFISTLGYCDKSANIVTPNTCSFPKKIFLYENTNILGGACFIINSLGENGKFIMKKNSGAAQNLVVITGNHQRQEGHWFKEMLLKHTLDIDKDVVVEEDVWLGANVTILPGVTIGRGATVGAGSVCVKSVPPYAVVMGNPAKVVGFNFAPEKVIEHELALYSTEERLPIDLLEKNYKKYFLDRVSEIKSITKL